MKALRRFLLRLKALLRDSGQGRVSGRGYLIGTEGAQVTRRREQGRSTHQTAAREPSSDFQRDKTEEEGSRPEDFEAPELALVKRLLGSEDAALPADDERGKRTIISHRARPIRGVPFHVQHNTNRSVLEAIFRCHIEDGVISLDKVASLLNLSPSTVKGSIRPFLKQLGMLSHDTPVHLTQWGRALCRMWRERSELLSEAVHLHLYTLHWSQPEIRFSWAYARVVDILWEMGECELDGKAMTNLAERIVEEAKQVFPDVEHVAFSRASIRGVFNWLQELRPPVIQSARAYRRVFRPRVCCPAPMLLWAVDALYRRMGVRWGEPLQLESQLSEQLCRLILLTPSALEDVLMKTKCTSDYEHDGIFDYGVNGDSTYWILLVHPCPVPALSEEVNQNFEGGERSCEPQTGIST